jgi:hypothetical protein
MVGLPGAMESGGTGSGGTDNKSLAAHPEPQVQQSGFFGNFFSGASRATPVSKNPNPTKVDEVRRVYFEKLNSIFSESQIHTKVISDLLFANSE